MSHFTPPDYLPVSVCPSLRSTPTIEISLN